MIEILSPLGVRRSLEGSRLAPRPTSLEGAVIGLVGNSKEGSRPLLAGVKEGMRELGFTEFREIPKAHASQPHPGLDRVAASVSSVVVALAD